MLILLIANVIILPVAISFFNDNWGHTGLLIFNLVSDSMFLLDIIVNFRTGKQPFDNHSGLFYSADQTAF